MHDRRILRAGPSRLTTHCSDHVICTSTKYLLHVMSYGLCATVRKGYLSVVGSLIIPGTRCVFSSSELTADKSETHEKGESVGHGHFNANKTTVF